MSLFMSQRQNSPYLCNVIERETDYKTTYNALKRTEIFYFPFNYRTN